MRSSNPSLSGRLLLAAALCVLFGGVAAAQTQHTHRLLMLIPASRQANVQSWWSQNIDPADGGTTWTVGLSPDGLAPATFYWISAALRPAEMREVLSKLCELASITVPPDLGSYSREQIVNWLQDNMPAVQAATGIRVRRDDNETAWSDPVAEAAAAGLLPVQPSGPAPTFVAAGTAASSATSGAAISPGLPSGWQADDVHLMVAHVSANTDFVDPAGWTRINGLTGNNTTAQRVVTWGRRAQAGDTAPSLAMASASNAVRIARIYGFRGAYQTGAAWDVLSIRGNAASAVIATNAITTEVPNCTVLFIGAYEDDPTAASTPTGYTPIGVAGTALGNDAMLVAFYKQLTGVGTENPSTTVSGGTFANSPSGGLLVALKPRPASP